MAQTEEITVVFKTEGGDTVSETFNKSAQAADKYHQSVTKAGGALGDLRVKSEARVANNISAIAQALTSGGNAADIATTAFSKVAESFRGFLPFAASAGILTTVTEQLLKARDAADEMHSSVQALTSFPGGSAFRGIDDIGSKFDALSQKLREVQGGNLGGTAGVGSAAYLQSLLTNPLGGFGAASAAAARAATEEQKRQESDRLDILRAQREEVGNIGEKLRIQNSISRELLTGDETAARLDQSKLQRLEDQERILARFNVPGGEQQLAEAQSALNANADTRDASLRKEGDLKQKQLDLNQSIVDAEKELLPPSEQNLKILELRASALTNIANRTIFLNQQERQAANTAAGAAQVDLGRAQRGIFQRGPFQFEREGVISRLNELRYQQARERFQTEELERRSGRRDVRGPGLRAFEEAAFGPVVSPTPLATVSPATPGTNTVDKVLPLFSELMKTLLELPGKIGVN